MRRLGVLAAFALACAPSPPAPANLVLLSLDTTRRDHLPFYGYERDTAPSMAELARRGVVFDDAVAVHTNTAPAHASILTGLHPTQHGIERNGQRLRDDVTPLAEILAARGYATAAFVSGWTLTRHTGLDRGFDLYDEALREERRRAAEWTLAAALPWLDARAEEGRPFFLLFHLFDPHYAYDPPSDTARRFLPENTGGFTSEPGTRPPGLARDFALSDAQVAEYVARYDGEIAHADRHLGQLVDRIEALGLAASTIFVFLSDHGETLHERAWVFDHGARVYDEQVRIPLVIRLPRDRGAGGRVGAPVSQVDLVPTLLDALGLPPERGLAGRSLLPLTLGAEPGDFGRATFAHARPVAARVPELGAPLLPRGLVTMVRAKGAKLIEYPVPGGVARQLFDLAADPGETRDLSAERPELAASLGAKLRAFRLATGGGRRPAPPLDPEVERALGELGYAD